MRHKQAMASRKEIRIDTDNYIGKLSAVSKGLADR
jgi:hypothetical protein